MIGPPLLLLVGIVAWTLLVIGVLIGMSMHREATRKRTHRLHRQRIELERERAELASEWRLLDR